LLFLEEGRGIQMWIWLGILFMLFALGVIIELKEHLEKVLSGEDY